MNDAFPSLQVILILIAVVLVIREIVCWYWKINELVKLMEKQHKLQVRMVGNLDTIAQALTAMAKVDPAGDKELETDATSPMLP